MKLFHLVVLSAALSFILLSSTSNGVVRQSNVYILHCNINLAH